MDVQWKRGEYLKFFANMKIRIGGKDEITIQKGDEFEYDGSVCRYSGTEFPTPTLRGAIRSDWARINPDHDYVPPAFNTSRAVAKSQSKTTDLSRVQRTQPQSMATESLDEETVLTVTDRQKLPRDDRGRIAGHLNHTNNRRGVVQDDDRQVNFRAPINPNAGQRVLNPSMSDIDQQDGRTIGRVMTPANIGKVDILKEPGKAKDIERSQHVDFGAGRVHRAGRNVHQEGIDIRMNVGNVDREQVYDGDEDGGQYIGQVRHSSRNHSAEGIDVQDTSNIRNRQNGHVNGHARVATKDPPAKKHAPAKKVAAKPVAQPKVTSKATKMAAKPAAKPAVATPVEVDTNLPPKIRMARRIDPKFPKDWSFEGKLAERMERVKKHGATPTFLEALYAAEGDQMRRTLEREFPQQFGG